MKGICSECGDRKNLSARGVCENRHGCQHRQFQHRALTERLLAEMDRQERVRLADARERHTWNSHPANQYRPPPLAGGKDAMNKWIDHWLHRPEDWGE